MVLEMIRVLFAGGKGCCFRSSWVVMILLLSGCAKMSPEPHVSARGGLRADKLSFYSDSFDRLREDIWERSWYTWTKAQTEDFKAADIWIEDGRLRMRTKTGAFSKASLVTKYYFRGDFDFQIDCRFDFLDQDVDMDQRLALILFERGEEIDDVDFAIVELKRTAGSYSGELRYLCRRWWRLVIPVREEVSGFRGTLRFIRTGKRVTVKYMEEGSGEWKPLSSCSVTDKDVQFGFTLQNFDRARTAIKAEAPIWATFDDFRINAAQEIVEEEI